MKTSVTERRRSALERRKKELQFWLTAKLPISSIKLGRSCRTLTTGSQPTDLENLVKTKIKICKSDIIYLENKLKIT